MQFSDLCYIDSTGYHYADFPAFLTWVQDNFRTTYGSDIYLGPDSQDGQFSALLAQSYFDMAALGAAAYNSFSPATGQGVGLARNVKINGITKRIPTHSTADVAIVGTYGTPLTNALAQDTLQQKWSIPDLVIPVSGTITVTATAVDAGAITAQANTITDIFTPTQGWQTITNPAEATVGAPVESDAQLRNRQVISTANPSLTVFEGTLGAVANVDGVTKSKGYENDTGVTDADGIPDHSIAIIAEGGVNADVAEAIAVHKTPGTRTFGTTSVPTTDSRGMPITINFYRPTPATISAQIIVTPLAGWSSDYEQQIKNAVAAYIVATEIGGVIVLTKLYAIAYLVGTPAYGTFNIVSIELAKNLDPPASNDIDLDFNEIAECDPDTDVSVST